jgi:hypothetical protein
MGGNSFGDWRGLGTWKPKRSISWAGWRVGPISVAAKFKSAEVRVSLKMIIAANPIVLARAAILPLMACPPILVAISLRYIHRAIKHPLARLAIWMTACVGIIGSELLQLRIYAQITGTANRIDDPFVTGVILCENFVGLVLGFVFFGRLRKKI